MEVLVNYGNFPILSNNINLYYNYLSLYMYNRALNIIPNKIVLLKVGHLGQHDRAILPDPIFISVYMYIAMV